MAEVYDSSPKDMPVVGTDMQLNPSAAALTVGTAAHSLELDDVVNEASLHPGVAVFPAALCAAWMAKKDGQDLTAAVVAGYEVMVRLGKAVDPKAHYSQGFHPTGTCGTFGAAVAAAKVMGLDSEGITNALGIAGSQAAGSMEFLAAGAYTKRLHAGWAAMSGLNAALLAKQGFTGPDTILEGRHGFLHAYTTSPVPEYLLKDWGMRFEVLNTSIKPHACCRYKQSAIDGILYLKQKHSLAPEDIEEMRIGILEAGFSLVADPLETKQDPHSIVDAQFSMPFGAAVAIVKGRASLSEYTEKNLQDTQVKELMTKVHCVRDKALEADFPRKWPASVVIRTKDGQELTTWVDTPKGDPDNPLSWDELISKFNELSADYYAEEDKAGKVSRLQGLSDEQPDIDHLLKILSHRSSP
jgi:2-methylcitrate dehydratase PrpD